MSGPRRDERRRRATESRAVGRDSPRCPLWWPVPGQRLESADRRAQALAVLAAASGISKKHLVCKYYLDGKCNRVHESKRCGKHHDSRAASSIPCVYGTKCKYSKCGYKHVDVPQKEHRSISSPSSTLATSADPAV